MEKENGVNAVNNRNGGRTMKTTYKAALIAAALAISIPLSARSEVKAGSIEVSPFVGYNFFESGQNLKDRPGFGGRIGYNFTKHLGMEGTLEYIPGRVDDKSKTGLNEGQYGKPDDHVNLTFYHIDAVYHFLSDGKFNPFIVAGIGGSHSSPAVSDHDMAAINVGVGAKYWVTDRIALRGDIRDYIITEVFQETYHNLGATVGVTFAFGGKSASEPAPVVVAKVDPPPAAPVVSFSADPATIQKGQCSNLTWTSSNASNVSIDPGVGSVPAVGSKQVCPASNTSYTITSSGPGGTRSASATVSVTEPPPPPPPPVVEKLVIIVSQPKVEEKIKVAVVEPKVVILAFEDVHFDFDKSTLKPEAQVILKKDILLLKENPKARIRVAGYTSASGTEEYNQKLSEKRAEAVKAYLVSEGVITADRLVTVGYGETNPAEHEAAPKDLYSDEAKANMRVLFEIIVQ
jgi:outer membrane beta-barrel protein